MTDRERRLMHGLMAYGWCSFDPWTAEKKEANHWEIHDSGFNCPVCGRAAPETETFPTLDLFAVPANHADDCALAELMREDNAR